MSTRRLNAAASLLTGPGTAELVLERLDDAELGNVIELSRQLQSRRAIDRGDHDEIIAAAFENSFNGDGLGSDPYLVGNVVVCPGALIWTSKTSHTCRFVSVNDTWVWDSLELIREDKRSSPGSRDGFRAVALIPTATGTELDVVSGKARSGGHQVTRVVSYRIDRDGLTQVSQRNVTPAGMK
ncbi:MAG: hypothetical protein HKN24_06320 [Acidimicrobiales bacterium]|nr:hypothetical protein [Acidimicrobiales bacterium]